MDVFGFKARKARKETEHAYQRDMDRAASGLKRGEYVSTLRPTSDEREIPVRIERAISAAESLHDEAKIRAARGLLRYAIETRYELLKAVLERPEEVSARTTLARLKEVASLSEKLGNPADVTAGWQSKIAPVYAAAQKEAEEAKKRVEEERQLALLTRYIEIRDALNNSNQQLSISKQVDLLRQAVSLSKEIGRPDEIVKQWKEKLEAAEKLAEQAEELRRQEQRRQEGPNRRSGPLPENFPGFDKPQPIRVERPRPFTDKNLPYEHSDGSGIHVDRPQSFTDPFAVYSADPAVRGAAKDYQERKRRQEGLEH